MKIGLAVLAAAAAIVLMAIVDYQVVDAAGVMGRGLSTGLNRGRNGGSNSKPWDHRRKTNADFSEQIADGENGEGDDGSNKKEACVGLCYYIKLLNLENKMKDNNSPNSVTQDLTTTTIRTTMTSSPATEHTTATSGLRYFTVPSTLTKRHRVKLKASKLPAKPGCVGLCYYYQKKGQPKVYKQIMKEFRIRPASRLSTRKPCVGLCQYYRKLGIPDPYKNVKIGRSRYSDDSTIAE